MKTQQLVGSWTIIFEGQAYTFGTATPPYRPIVMHVKDRRFFAHVLTYRNLGLGEAFMNEWFILDAGTPQQPQGDIYDLFTFILINRLDESIRNKIPSNSLVVRALLVYIAHRVRGHQRNIDVHYSENREMYRDMLGATEAYTCGFVNEHNSILPAHFRGSANYEPVVCTSWEPGQLDDPNSNVSAVMAGLLYAQPPAPGEKLPPSEFRVHPLDLHIDLQLDIDEIQRAKFDRICKKLQLRPGQRLLEIGCGYGGFSLYAVC